MKILKGYKTILINTASAVLTIAEMQEWTDILPREYLPWFIIGLAVSNMALRTVTTTRVGRSE